MQGAPARPAPPTRRERRLDRAIAAPERIRHSRSTTRLAAVAAVFGLVATFAAAPLLAHPSLTASTATAASGSVSLAEVAQSLESSATSQPTGLGVESYGVVTGTKTLVENASTNWDWARLVLVEGEFPVTESNTVVLLRWMRQENGVDDWWNRNNPLNNGNGSGGGAGLGSYDTLVDSAHYAADSLRRFSFYDSIETALDTDADPAVTAAAIWASPWATSHYANGTHWSTRPVQEVAAPESAWGR
ncbi:hypothetical protein [Agromyces seonyuensis]|uniref:Uncharacterized protein n=1 Tax=Agromyces seonyuensis TaxID=2662446 RepID=A0A6I4P1L4_9MICO|nr:hypothetical protein [Agromyces seonyuensis]MWB97919.1 hypothetical protein [Agromyces seonyuensis]